MDLLSSVNFGFDVLFESTSMGIIITDDQGKILSANPFLRNQLDFTELEITGRQIAKLIQQLEEGETHDIYSLAGKESRVVMIRKDRSTFPVSLTFSAMHDPEGQIEGYVGIEINMVSKEKAELDLLVALQKEKDLNQLKSGFLAMASHEFRTPLSTILSSVYLISKYATTDEHPKREKHVKRIVSSVEMLTSTLDDFLSVGKIEEGKIQVRYTRFDVEQMIADVVSELSFLLKKGQTIRYSHSGEKITALDQSLLRHILMNLISNAIKFSGEDAAITIETKRVENTFELRVRDEGIGISEQDQKHLFERFFRGGNAKHVQGTGLGLHIIAKFAELMNGSVKCLSKPGEGTTFALSFILDHQN